MARLLVHSDDMAAYVEITQNGETGACKAICATCYLPRDLAADSHEQWSEEDTIELARNHIDQHHS